MERNESWKPIIGYEEKYLISNIGRVKSLNRYDLIRPGNIKRYRNGRFLKPLFARGGYVRVALLKNGKAKYECIHRLVLNHFYGPPPSPRHQCNHRDGKKLNNSIENLEWVTCSENNLHAFKIGLKKGNPHHMKKIRFSNGQRFDSINSASRSLGISRQAISNVLNGRHNKCMGMEVFYDN